MHRVARALKGLLVVSLVIVLGFARCGWAHAAQNDPQSTEPDQGDSPNSAPQAESQDQNNQAAGPDSNNSDNDTDQDNDSDNQNDSSDSSDQGNQ
jgi:hypothetical protein